MAGSWNHVVNVDGTPYEGECGMGDLLENGGDINEAVEEMYGMIWYLAREVALLRARAYPLRPPRSSVIFEIQHAQANYKKGVILGKGEEE
jgi:hypothetical protein